MKYHISFESRGFEAPSIRVLSADDKSATVTIGVPWSRAYLAPPPAPQEDLLELPSAWIERQLDIARVVALYEAAEISEGRACEILKMERLDFRFAVDEWHRGWLKRYSHRGIISVDPSNRSRDGPFEWSVGDSELRHWPYCATTDG